MNLSSNRNKIVRTCDGVALKEGMYVYLPNLEMGTLTRYTVKHWHNGKNTKLYYPNSKVKYNPNVCLSGFGGAGIYVGSPKLYNPYTFIHTKNLFNSTYEAARFVKRYANKMKRKYKKIEDNAFDMYIFYE